jgi:hypothetical protein
MVQLHIPSKFVTLSTNARNLKCPLAKFAYLLEPNLESSALAVENLKLGRGRC